MTDVIDAPATSAELERARVVQVADNFVDLMRAFNQARARITQAAEHDVEWASHMILRSLRHEGPMRAAAIAEHLSNDPSTVSRQVSALVKEGYLERRADPDDGRASLLVLTERADQVLAEHDRIRLDYFAHLLAGWSDDELGTFAAHLRRFADAYCGADADWFRTRLATRAARAESTD